MPPSEHTQERVLVAMATKLAGITTTAGYWHDIAAVRRWLRFLDEETAFPVAVVHLPLDESEPRELGPGGAVETTLEVPVTLYHEKTDSVGPVTALLRFARDCEVALTTPDLHLGLDDVVEDIYRVRRDQAEEHVRDDWHRIQAVDWYRVRLAYAQGAP
jgi:hypothetical protein